MQAVIRSSGDLGRALATMRKHRGLSQAQVAELLGVDRSYVAKLERGHSSPLLDLMLHALVDLGGTLKVEFDEGTDG
jgi:transcriptional regulator with XRE-family HTH domain